MDETKLGDGQPIENFDPEAEKREVDKDLQEQEYAEKRRENKLAQEIASVEQLDTATDEIEHREALEKNQDKDTE